MSRVTQAGELIEFIQYARSVLTQDENQVRNCRPRPYCLASNACVAESVITPLKKNVEDPTIFYPVLVMKICLGYVIQQLGRWSHREWEIVDRAIDRVCMRGDVKQRTTQSSDFYL